MNQRETLKVNTSGNLEIGGIECGKLAKEFGTPLYVMDREYIENMCEVYSKTLEIEYGDGLILFASKAFSCKEIYRIINAKNLGADSVSSGELYTALSVNFPPEKICYHGNNKTIKELEYAISSGVGLIVVDAYSEAKDIDDICKKLNKKQDVLIRVNPGVEAHTHKFIQTATVDSKFGFSIDSGEAEEIIKYVNQFANLNLRGLHCHIGSQIFEKESFTVAAEKMTDFYKFIKEEYSIEFDLLNLGGGFGIYYTDEDDKKSCADYSEYIKNIAKSLNTAIAKKGIKKPKLLLEPGRSIVGEAGITLYTAGRIKEIKGVKNYIAVDGGMFDNPRFALYEAKYTVVAPEKMNKPCSNVYTIAGKCCESGDIIAVDVNLPEIKEGDLLAVLSTGAYNYSMSSNYNRNFVPPVVMVNKGEAYYAVKPQNFEDIVRNDV